MTSIPFVTNASNDFEVQFGEILDGTLDMFQLLDIKPGEEDPDSDVGKIRLAEKRIIELNRRNKEIVVTARNELTAIQRVFEHQKSSSTRSSTLPSADDHSDRINKATAERVGRMKLNTTLERQVNNRQGELERLQEELKDEEVDAVDEVEELNSEVLRVKLYRDFGFTPMEVNGMFSKVLVRSRNSQIARTIQLDSKNNDYFWANFLWDALGA